MFLDAVVNMSCSWILNTAHSTPRPHFASNEVDPITCCTCHQFIHGQLAAKC